MQNPNTKCLGFSCLPFVNTCTNLWFFYKEVFYGDPLKREVESWTIWTDVGELLQISFGWPIDVPSLVRESRVIYFYLFSPPPPTFPQITFGHKLCFPSTGPSATLHCRSTPKTPGLNDPDCCYRWLAHLQQCYFAKAPLRFLLMHTGQRATSKSKPRWYRSHAGQIRILDKDWSLFAQMFLMLNFSQVNSMFWN